MTLPIPRRTVVRATAWTVPAVTVAGTSPAFASSPGVTYALTAIPPTGATTVQTCTNVAAGTYKFQATRNGQPAPAGQQVTITLPTGLRFSDGTTTKVLTTDANGQVSLPAITPYGAAGTYTITATYQGKIATQTLTTTAQPGAVTAMNRSVTTAATGATFALTTVGNLTDAVAGSIYGDQYSSSNTGEGANALILTTGGLVRYWGRDLGGVRSNPSTLQYNGTNITGMTMVDNWTSIAVSDNTTGGVVANGSTTVYEVYRNGSSGTQIVTKITGFTGTVLGVRSDNGHNYLETTTGIWTWPTTKTAQTNNTVTLTSANQTVTGAVTAFDTWSHAISSTISTVTYGGAAASGSNMYIWRDTTTPTAVALPTGVTAANIVKIMAGDSGLMFLTKSGDLYSRGAGIQDANTWTKRATGIVDFSMWGFTTNTNYVGGVYINSAGQAYRFFSSKTGGWLTPELIRVGATNATTNPPLTNVVKSYSSDGTYMLLTADGKVYAAGGNIDNSGRTGAQVLNTGGGFVRDLNVWGLHFPDSTGVEKYFGGGYVITGAVSCA